MGDADGAEGTSGAGAGTDSIVLRVDLETADALWSVLDAVGEHQAAGAPIAAMDTAASERLAAVMRQIDLARGRLTLVEAMAASLVARGVQQ